MKPLIHVYVTYTRSLRKVMCFCLRCFKNIPNHKQCESAHHVYTKKSIHGIRAEHTNIIQPTNSYFNWKAIYFANSREMRKWLHPKYTNGKYLQRSNYYQTDRITNFCYNLVNRYMFMSGCLVAIRLCIQTRLNANNSYP